MWRELRGACRVPYFKNIQGSYGGMPTQGFGVQGSRILGLGLQVKDLGLRFQPSIQESSGEGSQLRMFGRKVPWRNMYIYVIV